MSVSAELGERMTVRVPAGRLAYRERGTGPVIVLAHGAGVNGDLWRKVVPELAREHRCITPDLPLGGHSLPLDGRHDGSLFGQAEILAGFIEALDLRDVTLIGNDTGGAISQALVSTSPERIGCLVLTSCDAFENYPPKAVAYLKPTSRSRAALWLLARAARLKPVQRLPITYGWATRSPIDPLIMESFLKGLRENPGIRRDFAALLTQADKGDMRRASEGIASFSGPSLVAWAAEDKFFPVEHGQRLAELLPRARFELIEHSRTFIPEDNPGELVRLVKEFLAS